MKTNLDKIAAAALTGTSIMTLFSYEVSAEKNKQFREPELLNTLLKRLLPPGKKDVPGITGWLIHYGVGLLFSSVYDRVWKKTKFNPTIVNGLLLGVISGLIGAGVWKTVLELHPDPPKIKEERYYAHLILAHLVFGAFAALGYRIKNPGNLNKKHLTTDGSRFPQAGCQYIA
jgi:hypothetical protein